MKVRTAAIACLLGMIMVPATVTAQFREYIISFTVVSANDKRALADAIIQVAGPGINSVEGGPGADVRAAANSGVRPNAAGRITFYLQPGLYTVSIHHSAHETQTFAIAVPAAGNEKSARQNYGFIELAESEKHTSDAEWRQKRRQEVTESRTLTVTVLGEKRDVSGRLTTVPLPNARVQTQGEAFGVGGISLTNSRGVVNFSRGYDIGSQMRITASAEGYETQERSLIIGSRQERAIDPRYTNRTTTSDQITITLRETRDTSNTIIVEVLDADTKAPISGARVVIELIGASQVAAGPTDTKGHTRPLAITPLPGFSRHGQYRVKVIARGYDEKWSDIPIETPYLRNTSTYVVHLEKSDDDDEEPETRSPPPSRGRSGAKSSQFSVFMLTNVGSWGGGLGALYVGTEDSLKGRTRCSFSGGGNNCKPTDVVTYSALAGPFNSQAEAKTALCRGVTESRVLPLGAGLHGKWQGGAQWYNLRNASISDCPAGSRSVN